MRKTVLILFLLILSCSPQITSKFYNQSTGHKMEQLNIKNFQKLKNLNTAEKNIQVNLIKDENDEINWFSYTEINKNTSEIISIEGKETYRKVITNANSPIKKWYNFYSNGNLDSKGKSYIGYEKDFVFSGVSKDGRILKGQPQFEFAIDTTYFYDKKGNIIRTLFNDNGFDLEFSKIKEKLLKENNLNLTQSAIDVKKLTLENLKNQESENFKWSFDIDKKCPCWWISYHFKNANDSTYIVSGKTGEIVSKGKNIYTE